MDESSTNQHPVSMGTVPSMVTVPSMGTTQHTALWGGAAGRAGAEKCEMAPPKKSVGRGGSERWEAAEEGKKKVCGMSGVDSKGHMYG